MEHKHYVIVVMDKHNKFYGLDLVDAKPNFLTQVLKKIKDSKISFSRRVIFTNNTSFDSVLESGQCLYYQITPVKTVDELLAHAA